MNSVFDFSEFSRQSSKGIIVIFLGKAYKSIKSLWVLLPMVIIGKSNPSKIKFLGIALSVFLLFLIVKSILDFFYFKFKIENNHFILKEGVLQKKDISIPFDRIQNINFKQSFIQQLINVTQVEIETAGAQKTEISIKALRKEKAEAIKSIVFSNQSIVATAQSIEEKIEKPLLKILFPDLVKVSITENHLKSFGVFVLFLIMIYSQIRENFKDFTIGINLEEEAPNSFFGIIFILIFAFTIGLLISFVRVFLFHFNLTLFVKKDSLEINQGLLTKRSIILKKEKVQHISITTNPLKQLFGISSVDFKQANSKIGKKNLVTRIVGCKTAHLNSIKKILFSTYEVESKTAIKPHKYYITRMFLRSFLILLLVNFLIFVRFNSVLLGNSSLFWWNLLPIVVTIFLVLIKYKKAYYKIDTNLLLKGSGQIGIRKDYFEFFKIQSIEKKQTFFQRQKNVVDLELNTANKSIELPCVPLEEATNLINYFLYKTETSEKPWI